MLISFFRKLVNQPYLLVDFGQIKLPEPWQQEQRNWKGMLLTQPPLVRVEIQICHVGQKVDNAFLQQGVELRNETGVTAGDVIEKLREISKDFRARFARIKDMDKWLR